MYSRSYCPDSQERVALPNGYYGTAFAQDTDLSDEQQNIQSSGIPADIEHDSEQTGGLLSGITRMPIFSSLFGKGGLLGEIGFSTPHIGTEELIIIAIAAFIFFTKGGDKETALILLLLLFIN